MRLFRYVVSITIDIYCSSGFVSNGYHKAYARALGKIRESINKQVTEELSGVRIDNTVSI
jgi:hypothetical protein